MEVAAYLNGYFFYILSRKHERTQVKQKKGLTGQAKTRKRKIRAFSAGGGFFRD